MNYTRSKIPFLCSGNKLQIFKYLPFERMLCIDTNRINFVYQKWNCKAVLHIFGKRKLWYWNNFGFSSGKRNQNHDVAATLIPGRKTDVETSCNNVVTTFLFVVATSETQRCNNAMTALSDVATKNQNLTLLQRHLPAGNLLLNVFTQITLSKLVELLQ